MELLDLVKVNEALSSTIKSNKEDIENADEKRLVREGFRTYSEK
jgi:hypothetical protein